MSGARKSPMMPRAISAWITAYPRGWAQRHLAPAHVAVARRGERETVRVRAARRTRRMKRSPSARLLRRSAATSTPSKASSADSSASSDSIGGVPHCSRSMPGAATNSSRERKRLRVPEPAGERLANDARGAGAPRRRTRAPRAAVEILVSASDGEIDVRGIEADVDDTGAVAEVPEHEGAGGVRCGGESRHRIEAAGPIVDMGEGQHRDAFVERGDQGVGVRPGANGVEAEHLGGAFDDIAVGGKVAARVQQHAAVRAKPGGGDQQLEQIDRGRIGDGDFVLVRADQPGNPRTRAPRGFDPRRHRSTSG